MRATRTVNPLHFEDLEPHRFEDLVRQLFYDYRPWRSIEAVGRAGSDQGKDIRAVEAVPTGPPGEDDSGEEEGPELLYERVWIIQCKRERSLPPKKLVRYVTSDLEQQPARPYGYILAAACDFSDAARAAFRTAAAAAGVPEFYLFGKGELEDFLFQPRFDHLLFAYFGISLTIRRRSARTDVRTHLSLKRKLAKEFGPPDQRPVVHSTIVYDPTSGAYPALPRRVEDWLGQPAWRSWEVAGHFPYGHLGLVAAEYFAYYDYQAQEWDAFWGYDDSLWMTLPHLHLPREEADALRTLLEARREEPFALWKSLVPKEKRMRLKTLGPIPYERILGVDELGDHHRPGPHLLVEFRNGVPFEATEAMLLTAADGFGGGVNPDRSKRIRVFPDPNPLPRALLSLARLQAEL